jgi:RNA polymerase-associated protein LEO1
MASSEVEDQMDLGDEVGDDLFGDDDVGSEQERALSDQELDSGDDEGRNDRKRHRSDSVDDAPTQIRASKTAASAIGRHATPGGDVWNPN